MHERPEWLRHRADALGDLENGARRGQSDAEGRADRLRGQGASLKGEQAWTKNWDTPERRAALRDRLSAAGVPDAADGRLLTDRAMGKPPRDAVAIGSAKFGNPALRPHAPEHVKKQQR